MDITRVDQWLCLIHPRVKSVSLCRCCCVMKASLFQVDPLMLRLQSVFSKVSVASGARTVVDSCQWFTGSLPPACVVLRRRAGHMSCDLVSGRLAVQWRCAVLSVCRQVADAVVHRRKRRLCADRPVSFTRVFVCCRVVPARHPVWCRIPVPHSPEGWFALVVMHWQLFCVFLKTCCCVIYVQSVEHVCVCVCIIFLCGDPVFCH